MKLDIVSPCIAYIEEATPLEMEILTKELTYNNTANQHLLKRHSHNKTWMINNNDTWKERYEELRANIKKVLIYEDGIKKYIRPASIPHLVAETGLCIEVTNKIVYPTPKMIPWAKLLPFQLHPYQAISSTELIKIMHGNVELCTGAGKSAILLKVCRETGFRTAIVAPSKSIFNELVEKFEHHFGKGMIGKFGDGKKVLGKRFTICIGDSLANVVEGTKEWEFFSKLDMLCVDESHTWGAETLETICHGVLANVPYRMFFSGTQTRGDGAEKLLQSIIGKTVCTLTTREAIAGGYISNHDFKIIQVESSNPNYLVPDALEMKRVHFLGNRNICQFVAKLANAMATTSRQQTLVLVEELGQIAMLLPLLKVPTVVAHSEKKPLRLAELGLTKVDPAESVEAFNKGEAMVLVGTSCIATGTNIFPTHQTVNWVGGSSEIKTKQGTVGRSVRLGSHNPWAAKCAPKTKATIYDFNVHDVHIMGMHLNDRVGYYSESGTEIKYINLKK